MVINMFVAATAGTLIPLALRALKVDPALASSVFITTLTDVFGFLSFLGLWARCSSSTCGVRQGDSNARPNLTAECLESVRAHPSPSPD